MNKKRLLWGANKRKFLHKILQTGDFLGFIQMGQNKPKAVKGLLQLMKLVVIEDGLDLFWGFLGFSNPL